MVVGAGPAGAAVAIALARTGLRVCMAGRTHPKGFRRAESLSPSAAQALRGIGCGDLLENERTARPCLGVQSIWMSPEPELRDYLFEAPSLGVTLDRESFDAQLLERAITNGVRFEPNVQIINISLGAEVELSGTKNTRPWSSTARFVVDATGKSSAIARRAGARRLRLSRQIAITTAMSPSSPSTGRGDWVRIEADANGWWSGITSPNGDRHLVRFLSAAGRESREVKSLQFQLQKSKLMRTYVDPEEIAGRTLVGFDAGTSALDRVASLGWLAVGEAAITFDPVASQGLSHAFGAAVPAAQAVAQYLSGGGDAGLRTYGDRTTATLRRHLRQLRDHYSRCFFYRGNRDQ